MKKESAFHELPEPVYTVLDPRSREPEVEYRGINPRHDTLDDKRVIVANLHGGNEEIMGSIALDLKEAVSTCEVQFSASMCLNAPDLCTGGRYLQRMIIHHGKDLMSISDSGRMKAYFSCGKARFNLCHFKTSR